MFEVEVTERDGWTVLVPVGDLDMTSAPALRRVLVEAVSSTAGRVAIDLSGVLFVDSQGLGTLVGGLKRARSHGGDLRLVAPSAVVAELLALTSLDRAFTVESDVDTAVRAAVRAGAGDD